jgi:hypothetical protein
MFVLTVWIPRASHVAGGVFAAAQGLLFLNLWALQRQRFVIRRAS